MSNEVQVKQDANVAIAEEAMGFNNLVNIGSQDLLIPKMLPMQGMSVMVTAGKAAMGEVRNSVSGELMGHIDKPMEIIPFFLRKSWDIQKKQPDGKFKYEKNIPVIENPQDPGYNAKMERMGIEDGVEVKRVYRYDYFVLVPSEVEAGTSFPYVLSFKSTSRRNGQKIISEWGRMVDAKKPFFSHAFNLFGTREKNDQGTFIVMDVQRGRACKPEEMTKIVEWLKRLTTSAYKVDESDVMDDELKPQHVDEVSNEF